MILNKAQFDGGRFLSGFTIGAISRGNGDIARNEEKKGNEERRLLQDDEIAG